MHYLTKQFKFEAGHRLSKDYEQGLPCSNIHGHSYTVWVTFMSTALNSAGMIFDLGLLYNFKCHLLAAFDHKLLLQNDDPMLGDLLSVHEQHSKHGAIRWLDQNPTCEVLAELICEMAITEIKNMGINEVLPPDSFTTTAAIFVDSVTVQETATGKAQYKNPEAEYVRFAQMREMYESRNYLPASADVAVK